MNRNVLLGSMLCILLFGCLWFDTVHQHLYTATLNLCIQHYFNELLMQSNTLLSSALQFLSFLGGNSVMVTCTGILLTYLLVKKEWKALIYCLLAIGTVILTTHLFKHHIYSPRPASYTEYDSFPSGHTVRASLWCGLILFIDRVKVCKLPTYARMILIAIPILVGFSRIALGRHWLDDVLGSYFLTLAVLLLLYWAYTNVWTKSHQARG